MERQTQFNLWYFVLAALADIEFGGTAEEELESDETLEEAEADLGVSGWVDPDTGDLGESWTPRLEDH